MEQAIIWILTGLIIGTLGAIVAEIIIAFVDIVWPPDE